MMKIMRSNYDKPHRCPGWSGPAFKASGGDCPGGSLSVQMYGVDGERKAPHWRIHKCVECGTVVLPFILRKVDPSWWFDKLEYRRWERALYKR